MPIDHAERCPLLTPQGQRMLKRLQEHPDAPRFNYATGDRLHPEDLPVIERFREHLRERRSCEPHTPPAIVARVAALREQVPFFRQRIPEGLDLQRDWSALPTTSRHDLALAPWDFVPDAEPLDRLVIYRTAGTTGHPIVVPHHPLAIRCYEPLIEFALERHGARPNCDADSVACFLVGAQVRTYTYAAVLYNWQGAGFAKVNLRQTEWPNEGSQERYFSEMQPLLLSGDPISFAEMLRLNLSARPSALVTTSVAMSPGLKRRLEERYQAPVIDWYSLVETGPIGYACPRGHGYHQLPTDLYVEVVRADGSPAPPGERGEIAVTGGRNPFAPLLRYRTGDFGIMDFTACPCGDPLPRLLELEGRVPMLMRSFDGTPVSTVDLSRLLREYPLLLHEFSQHADRSCELIVRPLPDMAPDLERMEQDLRRVLGAVPLEIRIDAKLGERAEGKALPYKSDLMLEDRAMLQMPANDPGRIRPLDYPTADRPHRIYAALTNHCNRACPWCSTCSSPRGQTWVSVEAFTASLPREGYFQLQLEGGEPTLHPQFWDFVRIAREHPRCVHLVLCTNGVVLPRDPGKQRNWIERLETPLTLKLSLNHHLLEHDAGLLRLALGLRDLFQDLGGARLLVLNVRLRRGHADDDREVYRQVEEAGLLPHANVFYLQRYGFASDESGWELPAPVSDRFTLVNPDGQVYGPDLLARSEGMRVLP